MTELPVRLLASPLHGESPSDLAAPVLAAFGERTGVALRPGGEAPGEGPAAVFLLLTGGTEERLLSAVEGRTGSVVVLTHGGHNSLAAGLEVAARLGREGRKAVLLHLGDPEVREKLPAIAAAVGMARALWGKRIGLVGEPSPWLVASTPAPGVLEERLGLLVVEIPLEAVLERLPRAVPQAEGPGEGIGRKEREMGPRVERALARLVEEYDLHALTVACFGLLSHGLTACWGLARLADRGIPAGCEGDLTGLLLLMLSQGLTGGPGFLANPVELDVRRERLVLAHCTVPLSLTRGFRLRTHFESGLGLAIAGELAPGPYTLARFGGERLERAFLVQGEVLPEVPGRENLCRTQVVFKCPKGALRKLLSEPLGNHHVLIPGHHRSTLAAFHSLFLS